MSAPWKIKRCARCGAFRHVNVPTFALSPFRDDGSSDGLKWVCLKCDQALRQIDTCLEDELRRRVYDFLPLIDIPVRGKTQ